jgi:hypothetical protein
VNTITKREKAAKAPTQRYKAINNNIYRGNSFIEDFSFGARFLETTMDKNEL